MIGLARRLLWGIPILLGAVALLGADLLGWSDGYGLWILCLVFGTGATYEALSMLDHPQGFRRERRLLWVIAFYIVTIYGVVLTTSEGHVGFNSSLAWPGEMANPATTLFGAVLMLGALVSTALSSGQDHAPPQHEGHHQHQTIEHVEGSSESRDRSTRVLAARTSLHR